MSAHQKSSKSNEINKGKLILKLKKKNEDYLTFNICYYIAITV
jgi:hypothetical protein